MTRWTRVLPIEHDEQVKVVDWARAQAGAGVPELALLYAVPNGGVRHAATAGRLKAEGLKKGVPDLMLPVARGGFFGLYVEMKRLDASPSDVRADQQWWHKRLREQGYAVHVARGGDEAIRVLRAYLALPPTPRHEPPGHAQD